MIRRSRYPATFLFVALTITACAAPPDIPSSLGGLPQTHTLQGSDGLKEINRLHGRSIPSLDAFVAHYERDNAVAMLYISRSYIAPMARWQLSRMVKGIRKGEANAEGQFFHLKAREQDGVTLYSAVGTGQIHYFYRSGPLIVWLAADPSVAQAALADTVRLVR